MSEREVIRIEGVSKRYRLGDINTKTLVEDVSRLTARLRGRPDPLAKVGDENRREDAGGAQHVWALRDVNLSVTEGEVVAVIGRNGAGKST
ncbi:MAG: ATP-binding cassette domain-containing protein, partial [Myxococcota bacterium]